MPIRDVLLTAVVFGALPACFFRPWIGVLVWAWIGYMNPHRLTWGFASSFPFAQLVAIATLAGIPFARDRKPVPWVRETYLLAALWMMYTLSTVTALYPDEAWSQWEKVSKVWLFTFVTLKFFQEWERLRYLFLLIALSIGFYGLKGGIWAIVTGGQNRVYGPEASFLGSNNSIGLALNMTLPFLFLLQRDERRPWLRHALRITFWVSIVAIIFTYSRGAALGLAVVLAALFLRGSKHVLGSVALTLAAAVLFFGPGGSLIPEKWWERINTISTYAEDRSAMGRLDAWKVASRLALDRPLLGGGFRVLEHEEIHEHYGFAGSASAHSIYFSVLGDHGFIGLGLFSFLILSCVWSLARLRRTAGRLPSGSWLVGPSLMLEASFVAYMVSGAFLTEAYFDLFYHLVSGVIILKALARDAAAVAPARPSPSQVVVEAATYSRPPQAPWAAR